MYLSKNSFLILSPGEEAKIICNCKVCSDETTLLPGYIVPAERLPGTEPRVPGGGRI